MTDITEGEWYEQYHVLDTEDGATTLISDTNDPPAIVKLVAIADPHFIWSQHGERETGLVIRPGFSRAANGWYVTERPWSDEDIVVNLDPLD